ncbi:hypothetical protein [Tenacibaculum caenipelagi]|uniref:PIN like domain-containing protein n=1 Tax=Tenacibaculum caenipelagi TaxID=1325435 RepID=A0A4R6TDM9_9FLAO|nr:hypothetical protein [Tenacibaculum caenipelagi]TDQ23867.1 hypothetical protein DFQ07_2397 [Tenacibaculum caenipelagi]
MILENSIIVFDTNSYRNFVKDKTTQEVIESTLKLKKIEKELNIESNAPIIVIFEMLANLDNETTNDNFTECLKGLISASYHCFNRNNYSVIPYSVPLFCHFLHQKVPQNIENNIRGMLGVLDFIKKDTEKAIETHKEDFKNYKEYISEIESNYSKLLKSFLEQINDYIEKKFPKLQNKQKRIKKLEYLDSEIFQNDFSYGVIELMNSKLGKTVKKEELDRMVIEFNLTFPFSNKFYKYVLNELISKNINLDSKTSLKKRLNWIWDYNIGIVITNSTIRDKKTFVVTQDKDLSEVIKNIEDSRVMTLYEYYSTIGYNE